MECAERAAQKCPGIIPLFPFPRHKWRDKENPLLYVQGTKFQILFQQEIAAIGVRVSASALYSPVGSQRTSTMGPPLCNDVPLHPVVPPAICSTSSGFNSRAPARLNTRFDIVGSFFSVIFLLNSRESSLKRIALWFNAFTRIFTIAIPRMGARKLN